MGGETRIMHRRLRVATGGVSPVTRVQWPRASRRDARCVPGGDTHTHQRLIPVALPVPVYTGWTLLCSLRCPWCTATGDPRDTSADR